MNYAPLGCGERSRGPIGEQLINSRSPRTQLEIWAELDARGVGVEVVRSTGGQALDAAKRDESGNIPPQASEPKAIEQTN